ncbi:hypothetical protein SDC9_105974 [bioreactor metagenome]|uniref:NAD-specific glutamate dehydrogenase n=1 Tax=bioreactor metagenome TaxID=1076179 RepID=A0A645B244_9ZZZZ
MGGLAEFEVAHRIAAAERTLGQDRLGVAGDQRLIDILNLARRDLVLAGLGIDFEANLDRFVGIAGELEHGAEAAQHRAVAVDFIAEIGQRPDQSAAGFAERDLGRGGDAVGHAELDVGAVFGLDVHELGQVDRRDPFDGAVENEFGHVEAVAGDVADGPAHFADVAAAPGGGFGRIVAVGELHVEAGVVDLAQRAVGDELARLDVVGVVHHHMVDRERKLELFGGVDHFAGVGNAGGHRFFDDDMLTGFERGEAEFGVGRVVGGHIDRIEFGIGQHGVAGIVPFESERFGGLAAAGIDVGGGEQHRVGQFGETALVAGEPFLRNPIFGDAAETDHTVLDFFHCIVPFG